MTSLSAEAALFLMRLIYITHTHTHRRLDNSDATLSTVSDLHLLLVLYGAFRADKAVYRRIKHHRADWQHMLNFIVYTVLHTKASQLQLKAKKIIIVCVILCNQWAILRNDSIN